MKRKCCGCQQRKQCDYPMGGGSVCDSCARSFGLSGAKPRNVAVKNSKEWQKKPCKHQSTRRADYRKGGVKYARAICIRCSAVQWEIVSD